MVIAFIPPMAAIMEAISRYPNLMISKWLRHYYPSMREALSNVIDMRKYGIERYNGTDNLGIFASRLTEEHENGTIEFVNPFDIIVGRLNNLSYDPNFEDYLQLVKPEFTGCDYALMHEHFYTETYRKMYIDDNSGTECLVVTTRNTIELPPKRDES